jgi:hypothetical protein
MKIYKLILFILVIFLKTGNVLSNNSVFDVNNIEILKKGKISNEVYAKQAINLGFKELINKILLKKDIKKLQELNFIQIKELVTYYQVSNKIDDKNIEKIIFNISFDKDKIHNLLFKKNISYSEIPNKELFILPVLKKNNQIYIYNQNFFYNNWNEIEDKELIEFILPLENIEIIQKINSNKDNLLDLKLKDLFKEYEGSNIAVVLIEDNNLKEEKIYFKTEILGKSIVKKINVKKLDYSREEFYKKIIIKVKQEITNLVKLQNLIDITAPSFLNAKLKIKKRSNLVELNKRLRNIYLIEKLYIQEFNKESVFLKIKYLGKLENIIKLLEEQKIILKLTDDEWSIKLI